MKRPTFDPASDRYDYRPLKAIGRNHRVGTLTVSQFQRQGHRPPDVSAGSATSTGAHAARTAASPSLGAPRENDADTWADRARRRGTTQNRGASRCRG